MTLHSRLSKLPDRRVGGSQQNPIHRTQADHGGSLHGLVPQQWPVSHPAAASAAGGRVATEPIHLTQADHVSTVAFQFDNKKEEAQVQHHQVPSSSNTMQAPDDSWTSCGLDADNRRTGPVNEIMSADAALTSSALCQRLFRNPSLRGAKGHLHHVGEPAVLHQHQSNQPPITARRTEQVCGMPLRRLANEPAVILLLAALPHQLM